MWLLFSDFAGQVRRNSQSISELDCYGYSVVIDFVCLAKIKRVKSAFYAVVLVLGLIIMISPLPEGTIILSLILSYFGYRLTGNIYVTIGTSLVTFIVTIILIKKLNLVSRFHKRLKSLRAHSNGDEKRDATAD